MRSIGGLTSLALLAAFAVVQGSGLRHDASRRTDIPICAGNDRAKRHVTCIVDGDTGWQAGIVWRLTTRQGGVDAPEISRPACAAERQIGMAARDRLRALMSSGYRIELGTPDRFGRKLAIVTLADGRDAGHVLIAEGLAQPWPNRDNPWCGQ